MAAYLHKRRDAFINLPPAPPLQETPLSLTVAADRRRVWRKSHRSRRRHAGIVNVHINIARRLHQHFVGLDR